uniref:Monocyte chemotactic protein 1B n=1 Tax=Fundulus heteroclitus TaxID=8078 RepID=A0A3Q2PY59_FUNHE
MTSIPFTLLLLVTMMVPTTSAQGGISTCCLKITGTKVHRDLLRKYYVEDPSSCTQHAVVFTTVQGKRICASKTNVWTKTSMAYIDGKNWQQKHQTLKTASLTGI